MPFHAKAQLHSLSSRHLKRTRGDAERTQAGTVAKTRGTSRDPRRTAHDRKLMILRERGARQQLLCWQQKATELPAALPARVRPELTEQRCATGL